MDLKPDNYRAQEVQRLARWILAGESGTVVGLAGCGRSNLLSFLCERPEVLSSYLPDKRTVALISVDLNHLPAHNLSTFYRVLLRSFYWERRHFEEGLQEQVTRLYLENRATSDPFLSQTALIEILLAFKRQGSQVVLVLNRFDRFYQQATPQMLNTLRALRDNFKRTLSFIAGMRQEVAYLPDSDALGDMYELLDKDVCWVGAMTDADARYVIGQATHIATTPPTSSESQKMLSLAGNFPILLKTIGLWWLDYHDLPTDQWLKRLATQHTFDYRLARMWEGLTQEEQFALSAVQTWHDKKSQAKKNLLNKELVELNQNHGTILSALMDKGVCYQEENVWYIRGELLAQYIKRVGPFSRGRIWLDERTEELYQGITPLRTLPPLEYNLLSHFIKHPYKRHSYSVLMKVLWPDDADARTRQEVFPLVRSLRQKLELNPSDPHYMINWTGNPEGGYQFYPEGRPS